MAASIKIFHLDTFCQLTWHVAQIVRFCREHLIQMFCCSLKKILTYWGYGNMCKNKRLRSDWLLRLLIICKNSQFEIYYVMIPTFLVKSVTQTLKSVSSKGIQLKLSPYYILFLFYLFLGLTQPTTITPEHQNQQQ